MSRVENKWNFSPDRLWSFASAGDVTVDSVLMHDAHDFWPRYVRTYAEVGNVQDVVYAERADFARRIRTKLLAIDGAKQIRDEDSVFGDFRISPLVVTAGYAWQLCSDLRSFDEPVGGIYQVAGSGADFAAGAMSALLAHGVTSAEELVKGAVLAACSSSVYCGGEMFFFNIRDIQR